VAYGPGTIDSGPLGTQGGCTPVVHDAGILGGAISAIGGDSGRGALEVSDGGLLDTCSGSLDSEAGLFGVGGSDSDGVDRLHLICGGIMAAIAGIMGVDLRTSIGGGGQSTASDDTVGATDGGIALGSGIGNGRDAVLDSDSRILGGVLSTAYR
jgi:hypothetical protein